MGEDGKAKPRDERALRLSERFAEWFGRNPIAWILLALLAICEWGNYHTGRDLQTICELMGPAIVSVPDRYALTAQQRIDNICIRHTPATG